MIDLNSVQKQIFLSDSTFSSGNSFGARLSMNDDTVRNNHECDPSARIQQERTFQCHKSLEFQGESIYSGAAASHWGTLLFLTECSSGDLWREFVRWSVMSSIVYAS